MELTPAPLSRETKRTKPFSKRNQAHKAYYLPSLLERGRG